MSIVRAVGVLVAAAVALTLGAMPRTSDTSSIYATAR